MEKKQAHLEMIQGVVNRLSHNSFLLKGWSVVLISALFALAASGENTRFICVAYFPVIAFWCLDGYFLRQERLFRKLFDHVRELDEDEIDFSMDRSKVEDKVKSWLRVTFSKTLILFHGIILATIFLVHKISSYLQQGGVQNGS